MTEDLLEPEPLPEETSAELSLRPKSLDEFVGQEKLKANLRITGGMFEKDLELDDDTTTGRWIPTTAIDQYFATLATWFGVDNSNLSTVFPNIGRFASPSLGFMKAS